MSNRIYLTRDDISSVLQNDFHIYENKNLKGILNFIKTPLKVEYLKYNPNSILNTIFEDMEPKVDIPKLHYVRPKFNIYNNSVVLSPIITNFYEHNLMKTLDKITRTKDYKDGKLKEIVPLGMHLIFKMLTEQHEFHTREGYICKLNGFYAESIVSNRVIADGTVKTDLGKVHNITVELVPWLEAIFKYRPDRFKEYINSCIGKE